MQFGDIDIVDTNSINVLHSLKNKLNKTEAVFSYSGKEYDKNGVIYWLGTQKGQNDEYKDPSADLLRLKIISNDEETFLFKNKFFESYHAGDYQVATVPPHNLQFILDLTPAKIRISLSQYTLSQFQNGTGAFCLRNWRLSGSHDGQTWVALCEHINDESLGKDRDSATWDVEKNEFFEYFCIERTGPVAGLKCKQNFTVLSSIELYGRVEEI
jgi:hypothetical protein